MLDSIQTEFELKFQFNSLTKVWLKSLFGNVAHPIDNAIYFTNDTIYFASDLLTKFLVRMNLTQI